MAQDPQLAGRSSPLPPSIDVSPLYSQPPSPGAGFHFARTLGFLIITRSVRSSFPPVNIARAPFHPTPAHPIPFHSIPFSPTPRHAIPIPLDPIQYNTMSTPFGSPPPSITSIQLPPHLTPPHSITFVSIPVHLPHSKTRPITPTHNTHEARRAWGPRSHRRCKP